MERSDFLERAKEGRTRYHWGEVIVLYDHPEKISSNREKTELHLVPKLAPYLLGIEKELLVISPYFVPGKEGVEFFKSLEDKGVNVRILTNSLTSNDVPIVHAGYSKYRKKLLEAGVELFEIDMMAFAGDFQRDKNSKTREGVKGSKASLHAKYFVLDREYAFIGSLNLDPRSMVENTEIGAVINSGKMAQDLAQQFDDNVHRIAFELKLKEGKIIWYRHYLDGSVKTYNIEPHSSWWDRFTLGLMKILPVESQL